MPNFLIWKIINNETEYLPGFEEFYFLDLPEVSKIAEELIASLPDSQAWKTVPPIGDENERWENGKGDRIFIRDQTLPAEDAEKPTEETE